jgi:anti-sigma factor RsiW
MEGTHDMTHTYSLTRRVLTAVATAAVALSLGASAYLTTTASTDSQAYKTGRKLAGRKLSRVSPHPVFVESPSGTPFTGVGPTGIDRDDV